MANREAGRGACTGKTDEVFGGNIRDKQRRADEKPSYIAPGKEVIFGSSIAPGEINPNSENQGEIESDDDNIRGGQSPVTCLDQ